MRFLRDLDRKGRIFVRKRRTSTMARAQCTLLSPEHSISRDSQALQPSLASFSSGQRSCTCTPSYQESPKVEVWDVRGAPGHRVEAAQHPQGVQGWCGERTQGSTHYCQSWEAQGMAASLRPPNRSSWGQRETRAVV